MEHSASPSEPVEPVIVVLEDESYTGKHRKRELTEVEIMSTVNEIRRLAGVRQANEVIERTPNLVRPALELAEGEWSRPESGVPAAMLSGYRDTLREYLERGNES